MDQDNILEYVWENLMDDVKDMFANEYGWYDRD